MSVHLNPSSPSVRSDTFTAGTERTTHASAAPREATPQPRIRFDQDVFEPAAARALEAPSGRVPQVDLQRGDTGEEVRQLQSNLVQLGFMGQQAMDTGPGIFGPQTEAALRQFQAAWGVPSTGYYGPLTREAMTRALSGAEPPAAPHSNIPGAEQAIAYAMNPPPNPMDPSGSWHYWCLGLVNKAYQSAGQDKPMLHASNAIGAYQQYKDAGLIHNDGSNPPRGALVFYTWANDGHVGISLGDGTYVGTLTSGPNTGIRPIQSDTYLGWAYP